jgi:signal transduction histidine kinase
MNAVRLRFFRRLKRAFHTIQWQITLLITVSSVIVCVAVLAYRYIRTSYELSQSNSSSIIANAVTQLLHDPWVKNVFLHDQTNEWIKEQTHFGIPPRDLNLQSDHFEADLRVNTKFFLKNRVLMYFVTEKQEIIPVSIGGTIPIPLEDLDVGTANLIKEKVVSLSEKVMTGSTDGQIILAEKNYSMALVPFKDDSNHIVGNFFLYVTQPSSWEMIRAIFLSSMMSFLRLILFAAVLGLIVGYIFSKKWSLWFDEIFKASNQWAEGNFSFKIPVETEQDYSELNMVSSKLNTMSDQLGQLVQTRQELAASEEGNRISRELHDNIKQQVFSINMNLGAAAVLIEKKPEQVKEKIELAANLTQNTLQDLDDLIGTLRPPVISGNALINKLEQYGKTWQMSSGIQLELKLQNYPPMDEYMAGEIFRICQEALSNMMRHSEAKIGRIELETNEIEVNLTIHDNGKGFDSQEQPSGIGLQSIHERVENMNGTFHIQSGREGTTLLIHIPRAMHF